MHFLYLPCCYIYFHHLNHLVVLENMTYHTESFLEHFLLLYHRQWMLLLKKLKENLEMVYKLVLYLRLQL